MSIKFRVLGGCFGGGGGGSADFIFMGARIFLKKWQCQGFSTTTPLLDQKKGKDKEEQDLPEISKNTCT